MFFVKLLRFSLILIIINFMLPVFLKIGEMPIFTQGIFLVLGLLWGLFFVWKYIRLTSYSEAKVFDLIFFSLFFALLIGRAFFFLFNKNISFSILKFILFNGYPGFSFYGGLLGGVFAVYIFTLVKGWKFFEIADYLALGFIVGMIFVSLGRGLSGEAVSFPVSSWLSLPVYGYVDKFFPIFFVAAIIYLLASIISYKLLFSIRRDTLFQGFNLLFVLWVVSGVYYLSSLYSQTTLYISKYKLNEVFSLFLNLTISLIFVYYFRNKIFEQIQIFLKNVKSKVNKKRNSRI